MHTSVQKPKTAQPAPPAKRIVAPATMDVRALEGEGAAPARNGASGHDFSQIPLDSPAAAPVQKKLVVNAPGDLFEQEADRLADQATSSQGPSNASPTPIQRFSGGGETAPASVEQAITSAGSPLESDVRTSMERRLGHDFSRVRVHAGGSAGRSAQEIDAQAYTVGRDLVFGPGRFAPETPQGQRLLAHELTHVVQQSGMAEGVIPVQRQTPAAPVPAKAEGKREGAADVEDRAKPEETSGEKPLSPLRKELFELFGKFEKKVIGDEVFEKVETEDDWKIQKAEEAEATALYEIEKEEYDAAMKEYNAKVKRGEKPEEKPEAPVPVAKFTTCIATQEKLLREAFKAKGLTLKKKGKQPTGFAFATTGAETAEAIAPGAWHWGKMGMDKPENKKVRPRPGDIIVMAFRSGGVDEAAKQLNYLMNIKYGTGQKKQADQNARAKLAESEEANLKAEKSLRELQADPEAPKWKIKNASDQLTRAVNKLNAAKKAADDAANTLASVHVPTEDEKSPYIERLDKERAESATARAKRLEENPIGTKKRYLFRSSHVGFLQKIEPLDDGREKWTTFDGGQLVERGGKKIEGSQSSVRYYDPKSNEISGEQQQGGEARWLYGWVDVDMLAAEPEPGKSPK